MTKKKQNNKSKYILVGVLAFLVIFGLVIILCDPFSWFKKQEDNGTIDTTPTAESEVDNEEKAKVEQLWKDNSAINGDYIGTIEFESGLISQPFVQGSDNSVYYRTNWKTMEYDIEGTVFLDSANTLDDQNLILIGHYVYESLDSTRTHMFTPLAKLIDQNNYEDNKYVKLYLENEVREYEIAYVYYCQLIFDEYNGESFYYTEDGYEFYIPNYTEEMFDNYISTIKENAFYDTGVDVDYKDKILTLQTCVENRDDLREIVVLKEISRVSYGE